MVHAAAGDELAEAGAGLDRVGLAEVFGQLDAASGVVAHGHAPPAAPAHHHPLEQRGAFPRRARPPLCPVRLGVGGKQGLVSLPVLEAEVARVGAGDERGPLVAGQQLAVDRPIDAAAVTVPPVAEGSGVAGVVQHVEDLGVLQAPPGQLAAVGATVQPAGEGQVFLGERGDGGPRRAGAGEGHEQVTDGTLDLGVGIQDDLAGGVVDQAHGQRQGQLAAPRPGQDAAPEPGPQQVQLGLGHLTFKAQKESVIEPARVIQTVLVQDQCLGQRADLQQPLPIGVVAGQPRHLQADDDARLAHADIGHQALEALAVSCGRP